MKNKLGLVPILLLVFLFCGCSLALQIDPEQRFDLLVIRCTGAFVDIEDEFDLHWVEVLYEYEDQYGKDRMDSAEISQDTLSDSGEEYRLAENNCLFIPVLLPDGAEIISIEFSAGVLYGRDALDLTPTNVADHPLTEFENPYAMEATWYCSFSWQKAMENVQ